MDDNVIVGSEYEVGNFDQIPIMYDILLDFSGYERP
jgi:hypothetical protein